MSSNTIPCWACSYSDLESQAKCLVCSPSSSASSRTRLLRPSTTNSRWTLLTTSTTKLQELWQLCGSGITQEWREALDLIKTLYPARLCTSSLEADSFTEERSPPTVLLQDSDYFEKTPAITLTSASSNSAPTMNLVTWHTFKQSVWPTTDVHITTIQGGKKKHIGKKNHCRLCKRDLVVNRKWSEAMRMERTIETKGKGEVVGQDEYIELERIMRSLSLEDRRPCRDAVMIDSWLEMIT